MTYPSNQHVKNLLHDRMSFEEAPSQVSNGKDLLSPPKIITPVSELIKNYIEEQFFILNHKK